MSLKLLSYSWILAFVLSSQIGLGQTKLFTNGELPTEHIYRILQDKEGYIWILTEEGIVKYNGTDTRTFTVKDGLPTNDIFNGYVTDKNQFWFMCKGNKQGYIKNDTVWSYPLPNNESFYFHGINYRAEDIVYTGYRNNYDFFEHQFKGRKWISKEIEIPNGSHYKFYISHEKVLYIDNSRPNTISFHSENNEELFSITDPEIAANRDNKTEIYKDYLIVRTASKVFIIDLNTSKITTLDFKKYNTQELFTNFVNGRFQITGKNFVVQLDDKLRITQEYSFDEKYNAHANYIDKEGNLWLGSLTTGVHFMSKDAYFAQLENEIKDIKQSELFNNNLYYTDYRGICIFGKDVLYFSENNQFTSLGMANNELLIGTWQNGELSSYTATKLNNEKIKEFKIAIRTVHYFNKKYYLSPNSSSVYVYDSLFADPTLKLGHFNSFASHNDSLVYGNNNGLYYFESNRLVQNFTKPIKSLRSRENKLYLGTIGYGLSVMENGEINNYPLNNVIINDIKFIGDSLVFCSSNQGVICLVNRNDSLIPYYVYDKKDGLISLHINTVHINSVENIFIATKKGILKTRLKKPQDVITKSFPILIDYIKWNNKNITDSVYEFVNENENNSFNLKFSKIKFSKSEFYCKINNSPFSKIEKGEINLYNLTPGNYNLTLKTESSFYDEEIREFKFSVYAKWYKSSWFFMVCIISGIIILFFIIRHNRIKRNNKTIYKLKKQAELSDYKLHALRSQMNPHFVFNSLNSIQYYISENKNDLSEKYLVKFSNLIRKFFDLSTKKDISIKKEAELLDNYLEIEKMRFEDKLNYTITIDKNLDKSTTIPTMILQPIVENSVNHGIFHKEDEGLIEISFNQLENNKIEVIISDDGVGIENSSSLKSTSINKHLSKSTLIFKERIDLLNNSKQWKIDYKIEKLREHPKYPGTKTTLTLERNK